MSERAAILGRIREALRVPTHRPHSHTEEVAETGIDVSQWLPRVGPTLDEQLALFAKNAAELKATFRLSDSIDEQIAQLREEAIVNDWERIASHRSEIAQRAIDTLGLPVLWTDGGYDSRELEQCDAGITLCDALVAQTGSVLVTSRSSGGRALSVLPAHHVVLCERSQVVSDLPAAFALLRSSYDNPFPSFMSLITGPSRTGDIERILVLGAHGPKKLSILCR